MAAFDRALLRLVNDQRWPVTVRQIYYLAIPAGLVPKTDAGYKTVIRRLSILREGDVLPWHCIADNTRWVRQAISYAGIWAAVDEWQAMYRRDYWRDQPERVELWVESDSIASFLSAEVNRFGIPMFVCKGQASKSYIHAAAEQATEIGKPITVLYLGDFDPTGVQIDKSLTERYTRYGATDLRVGRIGITPDQVRALRLVGTPAKSSDPNHAKFAALCRLHNLPVQAVETEAMEPATLRRLVIDSINKHIDSEAWQAAGDYEQAERAQLVSLFGGDHRG